MTKEEKLIRARQAAAALDPSFKDSFLAGRLDNWRLIQSAIYVLDHLDEPIVDPDLIEARKMCAETYPQYAEGYLAGGYDKASLVPPILAAIKRGRELERGE